MFRPLRSLCFVPDNRESKPTWIVNAAIHCVGLGAGKQGRLGTGRGAVDLVRQHKVGEERAGPELELTGLLVVEIDAGQIGGQQVGRELHPFEVPAHRARKCTQEHGFAGAGLILQQYMASAEEADQNFLGSILLAHNDTGTVGHNFFAVGGKSGSV